MCIRACTPIPCSTPAPPHFVTPTHSPSLTHSSILFPLTPSISLSTHSLPPSLPPSIPPFLSLSPSLPPSLTLFSNNTEPNGAECHIIHLNRPPGTSLGFSIVGGRRSPKGDCPVFIKSLAPKSIAESDGRLHCGDELVAVNNISLRDFSQQEVVQLFRDLSGPVSLTIRSTEDSGH